jgi:DNA repair protein RadA/Sms
MRADRICGGIPDSLYILSETNMENIIIQQEALKPVFMIIDSIQTMYSDSIDSAPGSVSQVRVCGNELMRIGKGLELPILIVAHVTKSGELAGPKIVEHLVDTVLHFTGERSQDLRILRSHKNRFGTTNEIGAFEMRESGLSEVPNLSESLMEDMGSGSEGSIATAVYEGTRPLILEIQALTIASNPGFGRRTAIGVELSRLNMILAVLEKRAGISLTNQDVYVNIVGGIRPEGTASDLAVALAVYSSYSGKKAPEMTIALGEIGLTGELRSVQHTDKIVREAERMGFKSVILPEKNVHRLRQQNPASIKIIGVQSIRNALRLMS